MAPPQPISARARSKLSKQRRKAAGHAHNGYSLLFAPPFPSLHYGYQQFHSWNNADLRERIHYLEIEKVVKEQTGAEKVLILGGTVRTRLFREPERRPDPSPPPEGTVLLNTNNGNCPAFKADRPRVHGFDQG